MSKLIFFCLLIGVVTAAPVEAQCYHWGQKYCWCCRRYMDPTTANEDGNYYGYVDNINYADPYKLPLNYYFNYGPRCRRNNQYYFRECIRYSSNPTQ